MSPVLVDRSLHRSYQLINEGSYSRDAGISHIELWPIVLPVSDTLSFDQGANRKRKEHEYDCTGETSRHATVEICTWLFITYFDEPRSARRARALMIIPFINVHLLPPLFRRPRANGFPFWLGYRGGYTVERILFSRLLRSILWDSSRLYLGTE